MKNKQEILNGFAEIHFFEWMKLQCVEVITKHEEGNKKAMNIVWLLHYALLKQWLYENNFIADIIPVFCDKNKIKFTPNPIFPDYGEHKIKWSFRSYKDKNIAEKHSLKECIRIYNLKQQNYCNKKI